MDFMGAHLLADKFARRIVAGPYTDGEDTPTPAKGPSRGGSFDPNSFNDDRAPLKPLPTKPTPPGIQRPNVPQLMAPQSLQIRPQPPMPWEMPASQVPGENGAPPRMPGMGMPPTPGMMPPRNNAPPSMLRSPLAPKTNAPPTPGLKGPTKTPSLKAPKPISQSPSSKPPHQQSEPSRPSSPKPSGESKSRLSAFDYLNSTGGDEQPGGMPSAPPPMPSAPPPMPPTPAPMQEQGLPSVGDMEPDWGHGSGEDHLGDDGWGGHPMLDDPQWTARRKGMMFSRLRLRR
jgi:hypothetical protein